ncbi:SEL1-like repeat protein [Desulfobacter curvatus]|uniref:SEL1-like repeat protein n=1 Tax=Desulfobacter curvatus TaxID=2290 RepID=UPI000380AF25|nr:SEL1-like repeat protein [Desulfobacter curvatus]
MTFFMLAVIPSVYAAMSIDAFTHYSRHKGYGKLRKIEYFISSVFSFLSIIGSIVICYIVFTTTKYQGSIFRLVLFWVIYFVVFLCFRKIMNMWRKFKKEAIEQKSETLCRCEFCKSDVVPINNKTNYWLHGIMALSTAMTWCVVWFFLAVKNTMSWKCPKCGEINTGDGEGPEAKTKGDNSQIHVTNEEVEKADRFFNEENYDLALDALKDNPDPENVKACYILSQLHLLDDKEWYNAEKAVEWLRYAAERGYTEALYDLGRLYMSGAHVEQNDQIGWRWISRAAMQGHTDSQLWIANTYAYGNFIPKQKQSYYMAYVFTAIYLKNRPDDEEALQILEEAESNMTDEEIEKAKEKASEWEPKPPQDYRDRETRYNN